jgi:hypothetical protein
MVTTSTDARATTILQGSANWTPWYAAKRRYATIKGVWQYCDPDSATKSPLPVTEPSDDDPAGTWKIWVIKSSRQESIQKAIGEVNLEILRTVAMTYIHLIDGAEHDDPQSQLMTLRKHFKVTDQQRRLELATQYSDIQKKPTAGSTQYCTCQWQSDIAAASLEAGSKTWQTPPLLLTRASLTPWRQRRAGGGCPTPHMIFLALCTAAPCQLAMQSTGQQLLLCYPAQLIPVTSTISSCLP